MGQTVLWKVSTGGLCAPLWPPAGVVSLDSNGRQCPGASPPMGHEDSGADTVHNPQAHSIENPPERLTLQRESSLPSLCLTWEFNRNGS